MLESRACVLYTLHNTHKQHASAATTTWPLRPQLKGTRPPSPARPAAAWRSGPTSSGPPGWLVSSRSPQCSRRSPRGAPCRSPPLPCAPCDARASRTGGWAAPIARSAKERGGGRKGW
eukprot:3086021-Prymnesium_polylepis.2